MEAGGAPGCKTGNQAPLTVSVHYRGQSRAPAALCSYKGAAAAFLPARPRRSLARAAAAAAGREALLRLQLGEGGLQGVGAHDQLLIPHGF